jgi:hypothetical protein
MAVSLFTSSVIVGIACGKKKKVFVEGATKT